jgi:predicted RNase H-like nuclease (RuvC/YqgF family)
MFEQIEQLEERITALVRMLEEARVQIDELTADNRQLRQQIDQQAKAQQSGEQLQHQVEELQRHLEEKSQKEAQIRDRLKGILNRIETLEQEAGHSG